MLPLPVYWCPDFFETLEFEKCLNFILAVEEAWSLQPFTCASSKTWNWSIGCLKSRTWIEEARKHSQAKKAFQFKIVHDTMHCGIKQIEVHTSEKNRANFLFTGNFPILHHISKKKK